jgi:predicted nucleotide-binding protein
MELGYFTAQLTRSRVAVLTEKSVEVPSDILGVVYTELDKSGAWRTLLGKELKAAGYNVDLNKL